MNKQLYDNIIKFSNSIGEYIGLEYESYHAEYVEKQKLLRLFDFVASYYMGGNNVPDTSRYVVELIKNNYYEPKT